ncbi:MAG: hypothetical protein M1825_000518 [Sarcosagium campestre]|nr:MAG: hypothetical protein M1825_000518 [Sarcosagium campestre]
MAEDESLSKEVITLVVNLGSPPPLHHSPALGDVGTVSTADSTPISTPQGFGQLRSSLDRESGLLSSRCWKPTRAHCARTSLLLDSELLEPDLDEDSSFPLFPQSPELGYLDGMAGQASPIDITTPTRHTSTSPASHNKTSNLTSALQGAALHDPGTSNGYLDIGNAGSNGFGTNSNAVRHDSVGGGMSVYSSQSGAEARPISMKNPNREKPRRESFAGSVMGGMSWGGVSVGSWIRDDIIMAGTSPFAYQTPSYHSSSYLPKLEANFMRDFSCCGTTLPSLHDLLQHYEESHAQQQPPLPTRQGGHIESTSNSQAAMGAGPSAAVQHQGQQQAQQQQQQQQLQQQKQPQQQAGQQTQAFKSTHNEVPAGNTPSMSGFQMMRNSAQAQGDAFTKSASDTVQDMDTVEDMEMDDDVDTSQDQTTPPTTNQPNPLQGQQSGPLQFGRQGGGIGAAVPQLNMANVNMNSQMQGHQGLRTPQPATPGSSTRHGFPLQGNPTVSSVNTPTLSTQSIQTQRTQQTTFSPESSVPGTPVEYDGDFVGNLQAEMSMPGSAQFPQGGGGFGHGFGGSNGMLDLCIDEPAKRLFQPNGGYDGHRFGQLRTGNNQFGNSELSMRHQEQQLLAAGIKGANAGLVTGEESKPFKCPVIGCEKAYKNQNGLKYHKTHGHTNQQLHENTDGTFSIVNPETSAPYPGTLGMEKEKPYQCDVCGKRYKNLNGLKYHRSHSRPCNPDLKLGGSLNAAAGPAAMAMGVKIPSTGLAGIGEE